MLFLNVFDCYFLNTFFLTNIHYTCNLLTYMHTCVLGVARLSMLAIWGGPCHACDAQKPQQPGREFECTYAFDSSLGLRMQLSYHLYPYRGMIAGLVLSHWNMLFVVQGGYSRLEMS